MKKGFQPENYINKKTGFVPASVFSKKKDMIQNQWWRDAELVFRAVPLKFKKLIARGLKIYMYKNQSRFAKFEQKDWSDELSYLPPLCDEYFETTRSKWMFHQNDCVGSKLYIASESKQRKIADNLINYLEFRRFYMDKEGGIWEGDGPQKYNGQILQKRLRASSICACAKGIEAYEKNFEKTTKTRYLLEKSYQAVEKILPNECLATETEEKQPLNLALLFTLYPNPIKFVRDSPSIKKEILENILNSLNKEHGVIRFPNDRWDGEMHHKLGEIDPPEWLYGKYLLSAITKNPKHFNEGEELIKKFGYIYESAINIGTKENPNWQANGTQLIETGALRIITGKDLFN